ncbi:dTDP-4-dehydrorhamnose reductase [Glaesserella sp.]|uniref:dTDP-4-dehydrorhamnose reductase n=1 Tax=Glaesserella sp. TaxID=2094731 RepID=UPI0035A0CC69
MAKFLITGAKGQVGHCLVKQLEGKAELLALDRDELDITDKAAVFKTVQTFQPDVVINAAAYTAVDRAESETKLADAVNRIGAQHLAEAAKHINAVMLHISTDYVFNGENRSAYKENDQTAPQSVYGITKLAGEAAVLQANPRSIILRTAWVFGEHGHNFVKTMLRLARTRDSLAVVDDQIGGPTYAGDIATALIEMAEQILAGKTDVFGIYHFSGKPYVSWNEFAQAIFEQANLQKILEKRPLVNRITTQEYPTPAKRPANSCLDLSKIKHTFNIDPSDWRTALQNIKRYL